MEALPGLADTRQRHQLNTAGGMGSHERPRTGLTNEWLTPPWIIDVLGPFDLDPCSPADRPWPTATKHYTIVDDGLAQEWAGLVWCNPPYGPEAETWLRRLAAHPDGGIALVFARTDTVWFINQVWAKARSVLFMEGRLRFHFLSGGTSHNAGAPSCLVAYGQQAHDRLATAHQARRIKGALVDSWRWNP